MKEDVGRGFLGGAEAEDEQEAGLKATSVVELYNTPRNQALAALI